MRASGLLLLLASGLVAAIPPAEDEPVALPPFLVEEAVRGPPWRFAEAMGFEILSRCRDATTRRVVEAHHQLHELLGEILPPSLRWQASVPRILILYDEELQPASSQEVIRKMLETQRSTADDDFGRLPGARGINVPARPARYSFLPNLRLWDRDAMAVFMIVRRDDFDAERLALTYDYITFLVRQRVPSLPPWFVTGFLTLYQQTTYEGSQLTVAPLEWVAPVPSDAVTPPGKESSSVGLLSDLFQHRLPANTAEQTVEPRKAWQAFATLFVRWALDAEHHAHRQALWRFVERVAVEGASESLFTECFGFDYAAARARLAVYLPTAVRKSASFRPARRSRLGPVTLSNASDLQIARLKGDWERLEVPYVKAISPVLAPKYLEQARRTLKRAYDRDHRDPRLLAVMGLCECDAGDESAGREYLEAAARIGSLRPRANYELARLRLAEHRRQPAASAGQINAKQAAEVLRPLFAARAEIPPLPEVYELIAEVWSLCAHQPTRGHLAVLDEGVRLFPRRLALILAAAELNVRHGFPEIAGPLIEIGLRLADDEPTRARFAELRRHIGK